MKILIAGGSGLIGRTLTKRLINHGNEVWVLSRSPRTAQIPSGAKAVRWDGETPDGWSHLIEEIDGVVNFAGENVGSVPWSMDRKKEIHSSRKLSGNAIVTAIRQATHRPEVVLQASGIGYYGFRGDEIVTEESSAGEDTLARISLDWEASTKPVEELGVRHVVIRTGLYFSREGGILSRYLLPFKMFVGGPIGSGDQWMSWIHEEDEISAINYLLQNPEAIGTYNLTAPYPVKNSQFGKTLSRVVHRPYWFRTPAFGLRLVMGEMSSLVLTGQRVIPKRLLELGYKFNFEQILPALSNILHGDIRSSIKQTRL